MAILHTSAATPIEEALVRIFKEVLDRERVSITDSFFAMGGDSIIGIQIVSRSNAEGIKVTLKQVFTEQTIERIAAVAEMTVAAVCEQGPVSGPVELMPVHKWFFEQDFANRSHYNQFDIGNPYRKISTLPWLNLRLLLS